MNAAPGMMTVKDDAEAEDDLIMRIDYEPVSVVVCDTG
jgi:hypothetical protein